MKKIVLYFVCFVFLPVIIPAIVNSSANLIIIWNSLDNNPIAQCILFCLFIILVVFVLLWGIFIPFLKIWRLPSFTEIKKMEERGNAFELKKNVSILYQNCHHIKDKDRRKDYKNKIIKKMRQLDEEKKEERIKIVTYFNELIEERINAIDAIILKQAKYTFFLTTISQNGKFDFMTSFCGNMRMIYNIVTATGFRPTKWQLVYLYACVMFASLLAYIGEDIFDEKDQDIIDKTLNNPDTENENLINVTGKVVGALLDGVFNALTTLTIGYMTKCYLVEGYSSFNSIKGIREIRKKARKDAFTILCGKIIVDDTISLLTGFIEKVWNSCTNGKAFKVTKTMVDKIMNSILSAFGLEFPLLKEKVNEVEINRVNENEGGIK